MRPQSHGNGVPVLGPLSRTPTLTNPHQPCCLRKAEIFLILLSQGVLKSPSSILHFSLPCWAGISSGLKFLGLRMHQEQHQCLAAPELSDILLHRYSSLPKDQNWRRRGREKKKELRKTLVAPNYSDCHSPASFPTASLPPPLHS